MKAEFIFFRYILATKLQRNKEKHLKNLQKDQSLILEIAAFTKEHSVH